MDARDPERSNVHAPTYTFTVRGRLAADWQEVLEGLTISTERGLHDETVTTLSGPIADQAALQGVLRAVHAFGLTLLGVARIDEDRERNHP